MLHGFGPEIARCALNPAHRDNSSWELSEADPSEAWPRLASLGSASLIETILRHASVDQVILTNVKLYRTDLRGISWLQIMELTLQPGVTWKDVLYDLLQQQSDAAQPR